MEVDKRLCVSITVGESCSVEVRSEGLDPMSTTAAMSVEARLSHAALCVDDFGGWLQRIGYTAVAGGWERSAHGIDARVERHGDSRFWLVATAASELNNAHTIDRPLVLGEVRS